MLGTAPVEEDDARTREKTLWPGCYFDIYFICESCLGNLFRLAADPRDALQDHAFGTLKDSREPRRAICQNDCSNILIWSRLFSVVARVVTALEVFQFLGY